MFSLSPVLLLILSLLLFGQRDAFWCPMHPDVRSADAGKCRLCNMDLVPIPPPRLGEYKMDVALGKDRLRFVIHEPDSPQVVKQFAQIHERLFHLFIVSRDLAYFAHEHPERKPDGAFELRHRLAPGEYMLIADFLPQDGTPQTLQRAIVTRGYRGPLVGPPRDRELDLSSKEVEGTRVRLDASNLAARRAAGLRVTLTDIESGQPVDNLERYLGAAGHMLIVKTDLTDAIHAHPEEQFTTGPSITFAPLFPAEGKYKLWVQFQRMGKVATAAFVVEVRP